MENGMTIGSAKGDPVLRVVPRQGDINANGHIFGGWVLSQMDIAAGIVAAREADGPVATVAIEAMEFIAPVLIGEGSTEDRAVGEDVEIDVGPATGVYSRLRVMERRADGFDLELLVTNDRSVPVSFEAEIEGPPNGVASPMRVRERHGLMVWQTTVPANGTATLVFRFVPL